MNADTIVPAVTALGGVTLGAALEYLRERRGRWVATRREAYAAYLTAYDTSIRRHNEAMVQWYRQSKTPVGRGQGVYTKRLLALQDESVLAIERVMDALAAVTLIASDDVSSAATALEDAHSNYMIHRADFPGDPGEARDPEREAELWAVCRSARKQFLASARAELGITPGKRRALTRVRRRRSTA